ncbi:uncharacterized protein LOC103879999 isoform X2 [Papio anubis]|uniref:uncharacterized protein LOC103879999 isoform X2 n=1 Tax=Papio anubis TaxID=9555 RepID=UPI000B7B4A66|nr:uncharacterized protein LOC103879999 isoform X2 [Papio anubis]
MSQSPLWIGPMQDSHITVIPEPRSGQSVTSPRCWVQVHATIYPLGRIQEEEQHDSEDGFSTLQFRPATFQAPRSHTWPIAATLKYSCDVSGGGGPEHPFFLPQVRGQPLFINISFQFRR